MPKLSENREQQIKDALDLYLQYNGQNLPAIEKEMRKRGYPKFNAQRIRKSDGAGGFTGWETDFGWKKALETHLANKNKIAMTSADGLHHEVESIRKALFEEIQTEKITEKNVWRVWEHKKYAEQTAKILSQLKGAGDNFANFVTALTHLLEAATEISPALAKELCDAQEALMEWAEGKFVTEKPE